MEVLKQPKPGLIQSTARHRRILAIVGDTQVGLWAVRSLARGGLAVCVIVRKPEGLAAHSRYAAGAWLCPTPARDGKLIDEIEQLARELDVGSVMAIAEGYHVALIAQRHRFEPDIQVLSPPAEAFAKATDKDYMQQLCRELNIPVARGTTLDRLMAGEVELKFPLVLRTSRQNDASAGGWAPWKAAYARTAEQLDQLYESVRAIANNVVVQEYHPGVEDHVQILMHHGEAVMVGEYIGEHHMPLAGGVTVQRVSCRHEKLIDDAVRLLKAIGYEGIGGVQFHYDPDTDRYIFLEINPRFIGGLPTVIMAGFPAPLMLWQSYFEPDRLKPTRYRLGYRTRILGGDANWVLGMMRGDDLPPGQKHLGKLAALGRFVWNCGPWTHDDVFCLRDPKPFWVDLRQMVRRLGGKSFDIIGQVESEQKEPVH